MSQGSPGYDYDLEVNDGASYVMVGVVNVGFDVNFESDDTTETGSSAEENTLTLQRATVTFDFVQPAGALSGGKQDIVDAFFAKTELGVRITPAGSTTGNNQYTFNARVHELSFSNNGPAGTSRISGTMRLSDGTVVSAGTAA